LELDGDPVVMVVGIVVVVVSTVVVEEFDGVVVVVLQSLGIQLNDADQPDRVPCRFVTKCNDIMFELLRYV
jgi:hypothetical protein